VRKRINSVFRYFGVQIIKTQCLVVLSLLCPILYWSGIATADEDIMGNSNGGGFPSSFRCISYTLGTVPGNLSYTEICLFAFILKRGNCVLKVSFDSLDCRYVP
jgi:hypothetical protein